MDKLIDIIIEERKILRNELIQLKSCQLRYFTLSVTTTGILLGLGIRLGSVKSPGLFFLAPLVIVLPCWWIFFDKATSITRMVGYIRVLEEVLRTMVNGKPQYRYLGWEVALGEYRRVREKTRIRRHFRQTLRSRTGTILNGFKGVVLFKTSHRYWSVNWYTYFVISVICWALSNGFLPSDFISQDISPELSIFTIFLILLSSVFTLYWAGDLIYGKRSYDVHTETWQSLLVEKK